MEIWKNLKGHEDTYEISNSGRIRNKIKDRFLNGWVNSDGYRVVKLFMNGKFYQTSFHRLVATHFVDNPDNLPEVNHKDGNKLNNWDWNLEWTTRSGNVTHAYRALNCNSGFRSNIKSITKSKEKKILQLTLDGIMVKEWNSASQVKRELGYCRTSISNCCNGRLKSTAGFVWKFSN